ncbi:MAG: Tfp pilus assembly protein FimT/FimU [Desulfonatronovibrio sp.]
MKTPGFTLIELLIVLFIVGLGWFSLLPKLDLTQKHVSTVEQINLLLESARQAAVNTNAHQRILLIPGQNFIEWNDQKQDLSAVLTSAMINSKPLTGSAEAFNIYPAGHMDELSFILSNGKKFKSSPLLAKISPDHD